MTALGVLCCFALFVCLTLLASFFLPSHLSFKNMYIHVLMRDEKEERKKQARSCKQTNKAKQHSTPKAVTFPKKNELPRVELEPTTLRMYVCIIIIHACWIMGHYVLVYIYIYIYIHVYCIIMYM